MKRLLSALLLLLPLLLLPLLASAQSEPVLYATQACGSCSEPASGLYTIDPATGTPTLVGDTGESITGLDFDPLTGDLYGTTTPNSAHPSSLIKIDPATAAVTVIGPHGVDNAITDLSFAPDGTLYGWAEPGADSVVTINTATGVATLVANSSVNSAGCSLDMAPDGFLYLFGQVCEHGDFPDSNNDNTILKLDPATGQVIGYTDMVIPVTECQGWPAGSHSAEGTLYGFVGAYCGGSQRQLMTLNLTTGETALIGDSLDWASGLAFLPGPGIAPAPVPPVPTMQRVGLWIAVILVALLGGVMVYRRKHV